MEEVNVERESILIMIEQLNEQFDSDEPQPGSDHVRRCVPPDEVGLD